MTARGLEGKKIGILVNSLAGGGAEKVVATLYPEYLKRGLCVSLLCLEDSNFYSIDGVTPVYLSKQTGRQGGIKKLVSLFSFAFKLKAHVKKNQISLVQSHIYRSNYVNVLSRIFGAKHKVQIVSHGMPGQYKTEGMSGKINRILIRWLYPKADQVVCPSRGMVEEFKELGVPAKKALRIPNPFDLEEISARSNSELDGLDFDFDPGKKYVISIGRLHAVKRMDHVILAFHELQKERDDVELIILGDGEQRDSIEALVMKLAISKKVHLPGQVSNPYNFLARSNVLLSASEFEGFSNVIVEALSLGVPVISTDCKSGPREILAPGTSGEQVIAPGMIEKVQCGLLVAVGNVQAMEKAMNQLLDDEVLCEALAKAGKIRARRFDKKTIADVYITCSEALFGSL